MGYRQYLYSVETWLVDEIKKCKTEKEFVETMQKFRNESVEYDPIDETYYVKLWDMGKELYEFGKYWENSEEMYKHGDSLFTCDELNERYEDYGAIVLDKDGLLCAIDWYKNRVLELYRDLLREKSNNEWDTRSQLDRLISHAKDYFYWWANQGPGNLDESTDKIVNSWLYEHGYFELVRIYKTFDWDNNSLVFLGW